ncbi:helix-turn-helix domain-containing protein [Gemmiger formicilis]|nr:helix-turn-helix domain-containing protein [Gemmiger formicilis]
MYQVNGASHTLQEGDLFLAKPNQLITYAADETDPWEYYWVGFNGACANKLVQQTPFSDAHPVHHCKDPQTVREALYNIYLSRGPEPQCEALMTGYLYIFMAHLMKEAREAMPNVGSSSSQYVLAAIKYIQFNYSHDISVDDIAKAVGVSRSHLYRVFMSNVGQSPIDYLTSYRISEACSLLKNSSLSIAEIAVSVGFLTSSIFPACSKGQGRAAEQVPGHAGEGGPCRTAGHQPVTFPALIIRSRHAFYEKSDHHSGDRSALQRRKRRGPQGRSGRFVPLTAPGDVAEVRIVKPMKTYAFGRVEKLLTAGPGRVRQDCPVAGPCGGCGLRHISYEAECAAKTQFVRDAFARLGKLDVPCRTCWAHPTRTATATRSSCPWAPTRTGIL